MTRSTVSSRGAAERVSVGGALLDASGDRYQEFFFLGGLAMFFRGSPPALMATLAALAGSFMVSYSSAKAEALRRSGSSGRHAPRRASGLSLSRDGGDRRLAAVGREQRVAGVGGRPARARRGLAHRGRRERLRGPQARDSSREGRRIRRRARPSSPRIHSRRATAPIWPARARGASWRASPLRPSA